MKQVLAASLFTLVCVASAQTPGALPTLFIAPMMSNFDSFMTAEVAKQHLPVKVVTEEKGAQLLLVGGSVKADGKWYAAVLSSFKDNSEGSVRLLDVRSKSVVWAGDAGDRSHSGLRKVAQRLAKRMEKDYFHGAQAKGRFSMFDTNKDIFNF